MNGSRWILALAAAIVMAFPGAGTAAATAQSGNGTIFLQVRDWNTGDAISGACFVLENASLEGCDENRDGYVRFEDIATGPYQVIETVTAPGYLQVGQFPIEVSGDVDDQVFLIETTEDNSTTTTVDVAVQPIVAGSGEELTGGCFIFYGGSNEGCDDNGDGFVEFDDVPVGSYLLTQTAAIDGYAPMADTWYALDISGIVRPGLEPLDNTSGNDEASDIALITRDPDTADLVTGTCYVLVGFSNEGCDENGDGRVTFDDVPVGIYEVEQTATPDGYPTTRNFTIEVSEGLPEHGIVVRQAAEQTDPDARHLSILFQDVDTGALVADPDACVTVENDTYATNEGCDDNEDGQVDFLDVPFGSYEIDIADEPRGYDVLDVDLTFTVADTEASTIVLIVPIERE